MSHHYIRDNYGDHCFYGDNAWKRKQRYDSVHGDTLIFNFGNSCGCGGRMYTVGNCCHGGSFWGGFANGLGLGFANLFSGFMSSMFMPMFGGGFFGGNMFVGMYGNMLSPFSMIPGYFGLGGPSDKGGKSNDTDVIGDGGAGKGGSTPVLNPAPAPANEGAAATPSGGTQIGTTGATGTTDNTKIGGTEIPDDWKNKNISSEDIAILNDLGVKIINDVSFNNNAPGLSLPKSGLDKPEDVKKLADIAKRYSIPVAFAKNTNSTVEDHWMAGEITVNDDNTYDIACSGVGMLGLTVKVSKNTDGSGYTVEHKYGTPSNGTTVYTKKNTEYKYNSTSQHLETNSLPVYSKSRRTSEYTEVK